MSDGRVGVRFQYDRVRIVSANARDSRVVFARLLSPAQAAAILLPLLLRTIRILS